MPVEAAIKLEKVARQQGRSLSGLVNIILSGGSLNLCGQTNEKPNVKKDTTNSFA